MRDGDSTRISKHARRAMVGEVDKEAGMRGGGSDAPGLAPAEIDRVPHSDCGNESAIAQAR